MVRFLVFILVVSVTVTVAWSQTESLLVAPAQSSSVEGKQSAVSGTTAFTVKVRSNLVQVRVVVRDADDKPVTGLKAEDFRILDDGQLQIISTFTVETPELRNQTETSKVQAEPPGSVSTSFAPPERFVALVFDDANLSSKDTVQIKSAAQLFLKSATGRDRIGIYSTSGQITQEFTSDTEALRRALLRVAPRSLEVTNDRQCPSVTYNLARQIEEYHDADAAAAVINETLRCAFAGEPLMLNAARSLAQSAIHQALRTGQAGNYSGFRHLEEFVRRLSQMPGQRVMVLLSPGFLHVDQPSEEWQVIDLANRANVVISTLDVRGLDVPDGGEDMTGHATDLMETRDQKVQARLHKQLEQTSVLAGFAYGTGGTFFHNSSDLLLGLRLAASPEVSYILGFTPQDLKRDGRYHNLQVRLAGDKNYSIQARRGYYAPRTLDAEEEEERQIVDDLHSRGEVGNLFLHLQAYPLSRGSEQTHVLVASKVAVNSIRFNETGGKHSDLLRVITAIFDDNGNVQAGGEKDLTMDLTATQYQQLLQVGLTVNSTFDLKPGKYLVRQLIEDTASGETSTRNQAIEIAESVAH